MGERKKNYSYAYRTIGSSAVQVVQEEEVVEKKVRRKQVSNKTDAIYLEEPKRQISADSINRLCTFVVAFVIIATLGVCVTYLETQLNINRLNAEIDKVKTQNFKK